MSKEHKDKPLRDAEDSVNDETLQQTMEGRLKNLRNVLTDMEPTESELESEESTSESETEEKSVEESTEESEEESDTTSELDEDEDEDEGEEDGSKGKEDPPEVLDIPDGYIRAAKRQGWSQEDIESEIESNPDRAKRLFRNAYETSNKATRDFAAIGRAQAEATRKAAEKPAPEIKDFITADEIATIADGDKATAAVLKAFNARMKEQATELAKLNVPGDIQFAKSDQDAAIAKADAVAADNVLMQVNQFFAADNMKPYADFYGVINSNQNMNDITPRQRGNRLEVLQIADQLIIGKASQGIEISTAEALESAHLVVSDSMREKIVTDKIRTSLKKRSKGRTLRPSDSKKRPVRSETKKAKTRDEAIANAGIRLAKLKW